MISKY